MFFHVFFSNDKGGSSRRAGHPTSGSVERKFSQWMVCLVFAYDFPGEEKTGYELDRPPHPVIVENDGFIGIPYSKCFLILVVTSQHPGWG